MTVKKKLRWEGFTLIAHLVDEEGKSYEANLNGEISDACAEEIEAELDDLSLEGRFEEIETTGVGR